MFEGLDLPKHIKINPINKDQEVEESTDLGYNTDDSEESLIPKDSEDYYLR